ncbi:MAG: hypothetical protein WCL32_12120 [Planctomycetota bacterium]
MPAPAVISCPHCESRFKGKPEHGGKKIKCPSCDKPFVVPDEESPAPKPKPRSKPPKIEAPDDDNSYGVGHIDIAPRCPNCAKEMLNAEAIICVHCGYNTMTRTHGTTKRVYAVTRMEHFQYLIPSLSLAAAFVTIVLMLIFYSTVLTQWLEGTGWSWITHESLRMWSTILLLGLLWGLGSYAFKTLVMAPRPPDIEKE